MFMKKAIVIGILTGSGAAAFGQAPAGALPTLPSGDGAASPFPSGFGADSASLAEGTTPAANADAEFDIDDFLNGSARLTVNSTSLPGLAEQSAEFIQDQGDSGGGDPASGPPDPSQPEPANC